MAAIKPAPTKPQVPTVNALALEGALVVAAGAEEDSVGVEAASVPVLEAVSFLSATLVISNWDDWAAMPGTGS